MNDYLIFHDESKGERNEEFWHAFYWVPVAFMNELTDCLTAAYRHSGHRGEDRSFKKLKNTLSAYRFASYWLTILKQSLQSCKPRLSEPFNCGRTRNDATGRWEPDYRRFSCVPNCKLSVFFLPNGLRELNLCKDDTARFETTFRMGLKNGGHRLFSKDFPCRIMRIYLDRERHYKRPLEKEELMGRIGEDAREYLSLSEDCAIEGEILPEKEKLVIDALDIMLGSFRHAYAFGLSEESKAKARKRRLSKVTIDLLTRLNRGDRMQNSRYKDGYTLRKARLQDGQWVFDDLHNDIIERVTPEDPQMDLFS